jgi:anhydro-N-acetylmuramic acid kinase
MDNSFLLPDEWLAKPRLVAGVMTGTSLDAIDTAIVEFTQENTNHHRVNIIAANSVPYEFSLKQDILDLISKETTIQKVTKVHYQLADVYANAVKQLLEENNISRLDAAGIHGQTVWHEPGKETEKKITYQLGGISVLAQILGTTVVGNFREADTALGGQGAPLIPIFDYEFFGTEKDNIIAVNIGGMANITLLPAGIPVESVKAFDVGPGNVLIDSAMKVLYNRAYDDHGIIAAKGEIIPKLLEFLKDNDFIYAEPPKSTGREMFGIHLIHKILDDYAQQFLAKDVITTLSYFTAWCIAHNIKLFGNSTSEIIVSGGGSHNDFILGKIKEELPESTLRISDEIGIPADSKEAISFAYLAYRTLGGLPGNIPSVTGASRAAILGQIARV